MSVLDPLFELQYAQWMMIVGGVLVVIGFFGFALDQNKNLPSDDMAPVRKTKAE